MKVDGKCWKPTLSVSYNIIFSSKKKTKYKWKIDI